MIVTFMSGHMPTGAYWFAQKGLAETEKYVCYVPPLTIP